MIWRESIFSSLPVNGKAKHRLAVLLSLRIEENEVWPIIRPTLPQLLAQMDCDLNPFLKYGRWNFSWYKISEETSLKSGIDLDVLVTAIRDSLSPFALRPQAWEIVLNLCPHVAQTVSTLFSLFGSRNIGHTQRSLNLFLLHTTLGGKTISTLLEINYL